jgi:hypothetical protein
MMRNLLWISTVLLAPLCLGVSPTLSEEPAAAIELRTVQLPGSFEREDLDTHLDYLRRLGFNALWVQAHQLTHDPLARSPELNAAGQVLVSRARQTNFRLIVALDPTIAGADRHALSDKALVAAIRRFAKTLRREAEAHDLVLSFESASPRLQELRDILAYGRDADRAHADLASRVRAGLPNSMRLWLYPARSFTAAGLGAVAPLSTSIGLVWEGATESPAHVGSADVDLLRKAVGPRAVLLRDRFPANQAGNRIPLSHNLGPLRGRNPDLAGKIDGHVSVAMQDWAASRLTLITVADWLRAPQTYDAKASWERAIQTLAGEIGEAREALRTQALEWGGSPGERNHHTAATDNPVETTQVLGDPALISRWRWTLARYPERMKQLQGLADTAFREELLDVMARRLAIAKAIPAVREILARQAAGRSDLAGLIAELNRLRAHPDSRSARVALERFLFAAGVLPLLESAEDAPTRRD